MHACMPRHAPLLQMHTVVEQPITHTGTGTISCFPMGLEPIEFSWTSPNDSTLKLDKHGSKAYDLSPGTYRVEATDAHGNRASVSMDIAPRFLSAVVVEGYKTTPASTSMSRDGSVQVLGSDMLQNQRFLWTNGSITEGTVLQDVPCGVYAAVPLPYDDGTIPMFLYSCPPAEVGVMTTGQWR